MEFSINKKPIAIVLIIAIILNLALFAFGKMNQLLFWIIIALIALIAFKILPKIK